MADIQIIAGLGNPGPRYQRTRHNAGFLVMEQIRDAGSGGWMRAGSENSLRDEATVRLGGREVVLVRPLAFMNRSGEAVGEALRAHACDPASLLVVVDDAALPPGWLRVRAEGGPGGHNGLRSIQEHLGSGGYARLRVGIGPAPQGCDLADYVLAPLADEEFRAFETAIRLAADAVELACTLGLTAAMDRFNRGPETGT